MIPYLTKIIKRKREDKLYYNKYIPKEYCHLTPLGEEYKKVIIENHKKLWDWIYQETLKKKKDINKFHYFKKYSTYLKRIPKEYCYLCEYNDQFLNRITCENCLGKWDRCAGIMLSSENKYDGLYSRYKNEDKWFKKAQLAKEIRDIIKE